MSKVDDRFRNAVESLTGNESLLEMLEGSAAGDLLSWGIALAKEVVRRTGGMEDEDAAAAMQPRLAAVRQMVRSIGNWAAGQYSDAAQRIQLRERLLEQLKAIFGDEAPLPTPAQIDHVLDQAHAEAFAPHQLIQNLKTLFDQIRPGGADGEPR
jgi:hypothetical protein